jgi:PAS domain S-box-containing protein
MTERAQKLAKEEQSQIFVDEANALARLNEASGRLWRTTNLRDGLDEMLAATIELLGAGMGHIQLLDAEQDVLRFAAQRGFRPRFLEFFREVSVNDSYACCRAARGGKPVVVENIELDAPYMPYRSVARAAGYCAVVSAPMISHRGAPLGVISVQFPSPHRPSDADLHRLNLYRRRAAAFIDRCKAEQALHESEERLRLAVDAGGMAMWDWDLQTGKVKWSDEQYKLLGYAVGEVEPSYPAWAARVHPNDRAPVVAAVMSAREKQKDVIISYRVSHADGTVRWCLSRGRSINDAEGNPARMIGLSEDITDRRQSEETQKVLIAELQHRTRNMIAVVQSIAKQTWETTHSQEAFITQFNARLGALSRVQGLLSRADHEPITIGALVDMEMEALGAVDRSRITLAGPQVLLANSTVEMLALAIHELATNARKYGALASERGRLSVTWRIDGAHQDRRLQLEWLEQGIAPSTGIDPARRGYGRTLIEQALPYSLSAQTKFELAEDAVRCSISLPLAEAGNKETAG